MNRHQVLSYCSSISSDVATDSAGCCTNTKSLRSRPRLESDARTRRGGPVHLAKFEASGTRARARETKVVSPDKTDSHTHTAIRAGRGSGSGESASRVFGTHRLSSAGAHMRKGCPARLRLPSPDT